MKAGNGKLRTDYPDVTAAEVKACQGFEDISDELAQQIADAIRVYTEIVYNGYREKRLEEQQGKLISIHQEAIKKAA